MRDSQQPLLNYVRIGLIVLTVLLLFHLLGPILTPFLIAGFLAYLGDPLVNLLARWRISRTWAATIVFLGIMLLVGILLFLLIPILIDQITLFINRLPEVFFWMQTNIVPWIRDNLHINANFDLPELKTIISQHWQQAGSFAKEAWKVFSTSGAALMLWFAKLLLIPVVTFYLLRDWDQVIDGINGLLPRRIEPKVSQIAKECDNVLGAFLRGQLLVMLGLAIVYSVGLAIAGIDLALLIGSLAGLLAIVPYLGVVVGILVAGIAAFLQYHDFLHLIYVGIIFVVGHFAEHMILTPWLVGDRIGLHPVAVIFAIMVGGHLFGFMGVLLALPVAAIVMVLLRHVRHHYVTSNLYNL